MTTRLSRTLTYDAPLGAVATMLADPDFRERVCAAQGALRHEVGITGTGAGMRASVQQVWSTAGVPSFAKKFVGDEIEIVQVETWAAADRADIRVEIPGKPGDMSGTIVLAESAGATTQTVTLDISVGIPFVGGKIEGMVADLMRAALESESKTGREWLAR
jgi:Protein of unknown function (DUF2505)